MASISEASRRRSANLLWNDSGTILLFGAVLIFALMGIAALTIDLGMGVVTRLAMQSSADSAALEGLRLRDRDIDDAGMSPEDRDLARRLSVQALVQVHFDDDFLLTGDAMNFGAGPVWASSGGLGSANAAETVTPGTPFVYKPLLQTNHLDNFAHGDMVAGQFNPANAIPIPPANERFDGTSSFVRDDFTAAAAGGAAAAPAFLVRLRRSRDQYGVENQAGVSSAGPALPFLFARGGTMQGGDPAAGYSPRHDGFNVRSSSIALARRATAVGLPWPPSGPTVSVEGVAPFALSRTFWDSLAVDAPRGVSVQADGTILDGGAAIGRVALDIHNIGQIVTLTNPTTGAAPENSYVPIFESIGGADRVIGFGAISAIGSLPGTVELTKRPSRVAAANASANFLGTLPRLDTGIWPLIFSAHNAFSEPLLAGALAR